MSSTIHTSAAAAADCVKGTCEAGTVVWVKGLVAVAIALGLVVGGGVAGADGAAPRQ